MYVLLVVCIKIFACYARDIYLEYQPCSAVFNWSWGGGRGQWQSLENVLGLSLQILTAAAPCGTTPWQFDGRGPQTTQLSSFSCPWVLIGELECCSAVIGYPVAALSSNWWATNQQSWALVGESQCLLGENGWPATLQLIPQHQSSDWWTTMSFLTRAQQNASVVIGCLYDKLSTQSDKSRQKKLDD
jgi:hypothetical protein